MTSPEVFEGLYEHNSKHLGAFRYAERSSLEVTNRSLDIVVFDRKDLEVTSAITNGLRFQDSTAPQPQELVCTLYENQDEVARRLVETVARMVIKNGGGIAYDLVLTNEQPLFPGIQIQGAIASTTLYFDNEFDLFLGPDGQPALQNITLIPITAAEAELANKNRTKALWDIWQSQQTDLLDACRPSAV